MRFSSSFFAAARFSRSCFFFSRSHFVHAPAMIRAVVDPSLLDRALIPYDRLLKNGRVLHARASGIDANGVTLDDGQRTKLESFGEMLRLCHTFF